MYAIRSYYDFKQVSGATAIPDSAWEKTGASSNASSKKTKRRQLMGVDLLSAK